MTFDIKDLISGIININKAIQPYYCIKSFIFVFLVIFILVLRRAM